MELGEKVSVDMVVDEKHEEEKCVFCNAKEPPQEIENRLSDQIDEDSEAENSDSAQTYKFKNDAGELGEAMGGKPAPIKIDFNGAAYVSAVAAHHLIPGNAALKKSALFQSGDYLWKDGKVNGNIGYNVNSAENGVWSPGNYGVRPWGTKGAKFQSNSGIEPKDFAFASIEEWQTQFHDAHEKYSTFVRDSLDKLYEKLEFQSQIVCPEEGEADLPPEERSPLFGLIGRLNRISYRMKSMLVFPVANWKSNIWTSSFSKDYMDAKKIKGDIKALNVD